jgi:type II secretory pathway pseudopilin PulG
MNDERRTTRAFTLVELTVAVAMLGLVLFFASVIFSVSINGHRLAGANAEIMQKLRAVTSQLSADFSGLQSDAPLLIWFQQDQNDPNERFDQIVFFADGDFQSTQVYDGTPKVPSDTGEPVIGNLARVYYGQAQSLDPRDNRMGDPCDLLPQDRLLARRQHILTADTDLDEWPNPDDVAGTFDANDGVRYHNERYEHDSVSLAVWETVDRIAYNPDLGMGGIIDVCFNLRPWIDMKDANTFHKLMCEGVGSFSIQWAYWDDIDKEFRWFPSDDPNGDGSDSDSHLDLMGSVADPNFGVYFNIPDEPPVPDYSSFRWYAVKDGTVEYKSGEYFPADFFPKAFKFTFTLYDSRGIIPDGRRFTHIVYLED